MQNTFKLPIRPRRLRRTPALRELIAETCLRAPQLVMPHFVLPQSQTRQAIPSMPGIERLSVDLLLHQVESDLRLGVRSVLLFGVPEHAHKDARGTYASHDQSVIAQAVRALKKQFGQDLLVATDVCLCAYTDHGHCGVMHDGALLNDATLPHLADMALAHARAGADIVAPSDMMDGRVGFIRARLDSENLVDTAIMAYSAKFASGYYGPFRDAAGSAPGAGDRKSYQMDARNGREAVREVLLDVEEGADIVMVKPALAYLDIIAHARQATSLPVAAYNVSGEYSMVKAAAACGWIDERTVVLENLHAMVRAGANILITYHARELLQQGWI